MARDYLVDQLLRRPALLSAAFQPAGYKINMRQVRETSNVRGWSKLARSVFASLWDDEDDFDDERSFAFADGLAYIPVHGILLNKFPYATPWATGYQAIQTMYEDAQADAAVKGIVFDIDSPGGMVAGCFELAALLFAGREGKPQMAICDGCCASSAYAVGSAVGQLITSKSSDIGSIGVYTSHTDLSGMLDQIGVDISLIYAGKHKVDGNSYEPLPDSVRADIQKGIDATYEEFVSLVALNRGVDASVPRRTEAAIFNGPDALALNLIDDVMSPQEAITAFRSELSTGSFSTQGAVAMTQKATTPASTESAVITEAQLSTARNEGASAERTRIASIIGSAEAKDRAELAQHLAFKTSMTAEEAKGILTASPVKEAAAAAPVQAGNNKVDSAFERAMDKTGNPNVSAGSGEHAEPDAATRMFNSYNAASGNKAKVAA